MTYDDAYRFPFGAAVLGTDVTLSLDTWEGMARSCELRLWQEGVGERFVAMDSLEIEAPDGSHGPCRRFVASISPDVRGVLWYCFKVEACDGQIVWYGAREGWTTGEGSLYGYEPPSFQLTVHVPRKDVPTWYTEGVVYQIFPDRFARGDDWPERATTALEMPRKGPERVLLDDWNTPPSYQRADNGDITRWDFYGGSFAGIRSKLDYLQALGVTVLYLNPIFEAASNHRYDTADYLAIDPMLGTIDDFKELCADAESRGMSIMLDGVFNHAGQDSRYFNAYGNYEDLGAAQSPASSYRDWFRFNEDGTYESWWGIKDLPEYNEDAPSLRDYFCGENGVVRTWLRAGAKGWRLDVADELPDSFIADIRAAALAECSDSVVIGEVWEDASNKYAYGMLRHYFQGDELDGVMNYPFRDAVIGYLTGAIGAPDASARLRQLSENYPVNCFACNLNLLGSHDRERIFTMLGGVPAHEVATDDQRRCFRLSPEQRSLALNRLKVAVLLQMTAPGVPSIYYGDEAGLQGFCDPYNRAPMPWGDFDQECFSLYRDAIALRHSSTVFTRGTFEPLSFGNEVLGWWRVDSEKGESACVLVNRSPWDTVSVDIDARGEGVAELVRAEAARIRDGKVSVTLKPFETSVLYFFKHQRLQKDIGAGKGVIAHLTSIPNPEGPGTLGEAAYRFVDWLVKQGYRYWQMLPVNPTDEYGSPYAGLSAFAGNPNLVAWPHDRIAYLNELATSDGYRAFCDEAAAWLEPYAAFCAIKAVVGEKPWQEWPLEYRAWSEDVVARAELAFDIERVRREQYAFATQWGALKRYANEHGIEIIGDLPMYVSGDSSDVWSNPELFALTEAGYPEDIAGVPPDDLGPEGQIWGNPTYRWSEMAKSGYDWWMRRLERMFALYDYVRLDHFLGFSSYYVIKAGQKATEGEWRYGPGFEFFERAYAHFGGPLPLIGENLGTITPAVRALVATCGFPGMDVIQFADNEVMDWYAPAPDTLVYLGTHDTKTLIGWCESRYGLGREDAVARARFLIERTLREQQGVVVMQLQDELGLGDEARMNVPGVAAGNWSWQAQQFDEK